MLQLKTQLQKKYSQIKIEVRNLMGTVVSGLRQSPLSLSICFGAFFVGRERPSEQRYDQRCRGATCHNKYYGQHASAGKVGQCTYRRAKHQRVPRVFNHFVDGKLSRLFGRDNKRRFFAKHTKKNRFKHHGRKRRVRCNVYNKVGQQ